MLMTQREALEVLAKHRGERFVVTTMSAAGIWPQLSDSPLDFNYLPSAMGHAPALGLGLALAQPQRGAIVVNGDGCMLMSLGSLVTLANHPANVFVLVMDNGLYEVTGGQVHAGAGHVDYAAMARAAGIPGVYAFDTLASWQKGAAVTLAGPGPALIWLKVEGRLGQTTPKATRTITEQVARLRSEAKKSGAEK
jgi:thiamine pyrophosphate-dependent acetolactate synthase large subunit-like protein